MAKNPLESQKYGKHNKNKMEYGDNLATKTSRQLDCLLPLMSKKAKYIHVFLFYNYYPQIANLDIDYGLNYRLFGLSNKKYKCWYKLTTSCIAIEQII